MKTKQNKIRHRIAIVEDDDNFRQSLVDYFDLLGFSVWGAESAETFYKNLIVSPVDIVILDIGLPGEDGFQVTSHLQNLHGIEILILSGRDSTDDCIKGLNLGAGRYFVKPIDMNELAAHVEAASRNIKNISEHNTWSLQYSNWSLISPQGNIINLTSREFALMECLIKSPNQTGTRFNIANMLACGNLNGYDFHRIDIVVSRLRKKIKTLTNQSAPIKTINSIGFAFTIKCIIK